jgi:hypothetical protein
MKTLKMALLAGALATSVAAGSARADVVNFDEFTSPPVDCCYGNPVTGPLVYPHVTISAAGDGGNVMNSSGWQNQQTSGDNLFGTLGGFMDFVFNVGVSNLQFDLINGDFDQPTYTLTAYDNHGNVIAQQMPTLDQYTTAGGTDHITFGNSGIWSFHIDGNSDFAIDTMSFNSGAVPEPETWVLMIAGLGLAGAALRRRAVAA